LVLETLLWPDEVRPADFPFLDQDIEVKPQELTMAASLIDSMTSQFDPDAFHDNYREALIELVEAKVAGRELLQPGTLEIAASPSVSLADALRASLAAQKGSVEGKPEAKAIGAGSSDADSDATGGDEDGGAKPAAKKSAKAASGAAKSSRAKPQPRRKAS
jgi:DNA end-binding protein Ku